MVKYLAMRISAGALSYEAVIERYPQYKKDIDDILKKETEA